MGRVVNPEAGQLTSDNQLKVIDAEMLMIAREPS